MDEQRERRHDDAADVTRRNVEQMRDLLASKRREAQERDAEPPLGDDPHSAGQEDELANAPSNSLGSTGGIRNLGGGRP